MQKGGSKREGSSPNTSIQGHEVRSTEGVGIERLAHRKTCITEEVM